MFLGPFYFDSLRQLDPGRKRKNSIPLRVPAKWAWSHDFCLSLSMWSKPMRNLGSCELEGNRGILFIYFWSQETCLPMGLGAFAINMTWMVVHYAQANILRHYLMRNFSHYAQANILRHYLMRNFSHSMYCHMLWEGCLTKYTLLSNLKPQIYNKCQLNH